MQGLCTHFNEEEEILYRFRLLVGGLLVDEPLLDNCKYDELQDMYYPTSIPSGTLASEMEETCW